MKVRIWQMGMACLFGALLLMFAARLPSRAAADSSPTSTPDSSPTPTNGGAETTPTVEASDTPDPSPTPTGSATWITSVEPTQILDPAATDISTSPTAEAAATESATDIVSSSESVTVTAIEGSASPTASPTLSPTECSATATNTPAASAGPTETPTGSATPATDGQSNDGAPTPTLTDSSETATPTATANTECGLLGKETTTPTATETTPVASTSASATATVTTTPNGSASASATATGSPVPDESPTATGIVAPTETMMPLPTGTAQTQPVGGLSITAYAMVFPGIQLEGAETVVAVASVPWVASDTAGFGIGWRVVLTVSDFIDSSGNIIPASNLQVQITASDVRTMSGAGAAASAVQELTAVGSDGLTNLSAAPGSSGGLFEFLPRFALSVPAGTPLGDYTTNIEVTIIAGS